ncbi:hypothetical protein [Peribacillus sp. FSL R5-0717]|uniref:hypothetical protein n=1 Tax=Peribacillus sp. FSL R5-0717 TaxID=2975308 RepID=UPI0030F5D42B
MPRRLPTARGKRVPGVEINVPILQTQKKLSANNYYLVFNKTFYLNKTKLIGTEGTRLLREKRV